jgi:membrane-associated protein
MELLHKLHDPEGIKQFIVAGGYMLLFAIVFAETGLLVGFLLPGDSLLFIAGFCAANAERFGVHISIVPMILLLCVAAIVGDTVGYFIGRKAGPALFSRPDSRLFKRKHLESAQAFYEKHGPKTIVLARFVPIVRTFAPTVAGAANMDYKQFLTYNVIGGIGWITSMSLLGYFLGGIEIVGDNLDKAVIGIVFLSILPMALHAIKEKKTGKGKAAAKGAEEGKPFATKSGSIKG